MTVALALAGLAMLSGGVAIVRRKPDPEWERRLARAETEVVIVHRALAECERQREEVARQRDEAREGTKEGV